MASSNSSIKVLPAQGDKIAEATAILFSTTSANAPQQLDRLARLFLGDQYETWVKNYTAKHQMPWLGE